MHLGASVFTLPRRCPGAFQSAWVPKYSQQEPRLPITPSQGCPHWTPYYYFFLSMPSHCSYNLQFPYKTESSMFLCSLRTQVSSCVDHLLSGTGSDWSRPGVWLCWGVGRRKFVDHLLFGKLVGTYCH